jgi:hypothetical protein
MILIVHGWRFMRVLTHTSRLKTTPNGLGPNCVTFTQPQWHVKKVACGSHTGTKVCQRERASKSQALPGYGLSLFTSMMFQAKTCLWTLRRFGMFQELLKDLST